MSAMPSSVLLDLAVRYRGKSLPMWCYEAVPDNMRAARSADLYMGRPVLYRVLTGPHKGKYYTDYVRPQTYHLLAERINAGHEVYVKDEV